MCIPTIILSSLQGLQDFAHLKTFCQQSVQDFVAVIGICRMQALPFLDGALQNLRIFLLVNGVYRLLKQGGIGPLLIEALPDFQFTPLVMELASDKRLDETLLVQEVVLLQAADYLVTLGGGDGRLAELVANFLLATLLKGAVAFHFGHDVGWYVHNMLYISILFAGGFVPEYDLIHVGIEEMMLEQGVALVGHETDSFFVFPPPFH